MKIKNIKIMAASTILGLNLMTGCGYHNVRFGDTTISYDQKNSSGTIKYEDLSNYVKVVIVEAGEGKNTLLLMKATEKIEVIGIQPHYLTEYIELSSGSCLIKYKDYEDAGNREWLIGGNLNIVEEQAIDDYLLQEKWIQQEYDVNEIIAFFDEKIIPTVESNDKEMIK
ncbi:MAG: hypothetical protein PUB18_06215 [bacterium]|nr:hypothetical protein [bacterium]